MGCGNMKTGAIKGAEPDFCCSPSMKCCAPREGRTDAGTVKKPAGAPPPSSKGSISYPKSPIGGGK